MKAIICLAVIAVTLFSCEKSKDLPLTKKEIVITKTTADIIKSDNNFGLELFQEVVSSDKNSENIFVSPTSAALALAMAYNGAAGETKTAMENALKKQGFTAEEINTSYKSLINALLSVDPRVVLEIANSIWYREDFTVLPEFITVNQNFYNAGVKSLDFNDPGAPGIINDWVSDKTHGRIKSIVDEISSETVMYLINAIYFKGLWQYEFDEDKTDEGDFKLDDGSNVQVQFMKQETSLRFASEELFSIAELPYGQGNYSMVVFLPQHGHTTGEIIDSLTPGNWDKWLNNMHETKLDVHMPKFTFEYKIKLNDVLESMGMGVAFTDYADFSKINGEGGLCIFKVLQKTFVEVNEKGTEAAAVTSVEVGTTSAGPGNPPVFYVDHPFLFAIRETSTGTILFIGCVKNPLIRENG